MTIVDIAERLNQLKRIDGGGLFKSNSYQTFGSDTHRYKLNRCLTENDLSAFENIHSIKLPSDYRDFLKQVGNGGAGPAYGLLPLDQWSIELDIATDKFLSTPFPHADKWDSKYTGETKDEYYTESKEFQDWETDYFSDKYITGSLRVCHYGCAIYYLLIVTGLETGNIWVDDRASDGGIYPLTLTGQRMTFSQWYTDWLTNSINKLKR